MIVVDVIEEVVEKVSAKMLTDLQALDPNITGVHYLHGHPVEIVETLAQRDQSETYVFKKYPLICLFQDFPEKHIGKELIEANLNIVICKSTIPTYKAKERYAMNFKPYLYPIYDEFLRQVQKDRRVEGYSQEHTKVDRLFWGRSAVNGNVANKFNDYLDAIELINFKIKLNLTTC